MINVWELEFVKAKSIIQCNNCKSGIDLKKSKKDEPPNPAIKAVLEDGAAESHFCDTECLRQFLNKRAKVSKK